MDAVGWMLLTSHAFASEGCKGALPLRQRRRPVRAMLTPARAAGSRRAMLSGAANHLRLFRGSFHRTTLASLTISLYPLSFVCFISLPATHHMYGGLGVVG